MTDVAPLRCSPYVIWVAFLQAAIKNTALWSHSDVMGNNLHKEKKHEMKDLNNRKTHKIPQNLLCCSSLGPLHLNFLLSSSHLGVVDERCGMNSVSLHQRVYRTRLFAMSKSQAFPHL